MARRRPQNENPTAEAVREAESGPEPQPEPAPAPDNYSWYQHVGWYADLHPVDVQDKLRESQAEFDTEDASRGWVVVPGWFVRDYFGLEESLGLEILARANAAAPVMPVPVNLDSPIALMARDILLELIRTRGDSTEWPRVAWERVREFVKRGAEG